MKGDFLRGVLFCQRIIVMLTKSFCQYSPLNALPLRMALLRVYSETDFKKEQTKIGRVGFGQLVLVLDWERRYLCLTLLINGHKG